VLAAAVIGCTLFLGLQQWIVPALTDSEKLAAQAMRDRETVANLSAQLVPLERQVNSPNAVIQTTLAALQKTYDEQEPGIQSAQKNLVTAKEMPGFLQKLLSGNKGLQLLSLETLTPESLINAPVVIDKPKQTENAIYLYKHGVRIKLSGSYRELVSYLSDLEQSPQRVLWGDVELNVSNHPQIVLTLTVYTLSLDKAWVTL
jgi:MSHA biogenesis protein MshJ